MFSAILSAVGTASELVIDKIILSREKVALRVYLPILFGLLFLLTVILVPFLGRVDWELLRLSNTMFLFLMMIVCAIAWNVLFYESVQKEKIHHHELIMMTSPLITVLLAAMFFPEDLDYRVLALAIIASVALIFAKSTKEHFFLDRTSYNTFLGVVLMSIESILTKELLYAMTPVALYAVRTLFVAMFFYFYYKPQIKKVSSPHKLLIFWSALIGVISMLAKYYAYSELGVVYTTMINILAPILVFYFSWEFLHERIRFKMVFSSLVVLVCVALATVIAFK